MEERRTRLLPVDEFLNVSREVSFLGQFARELARFRFGGNLACKKQPEHTLGDYFFATWCCRKLLLTVGDT